MPAGARGFSIIPSTSLHLHHPRRPRRLSLLHPQAPSCSDYRRPIQQVSIGRRRASLDIRTWRRPFSSRSPLSLTKTISSRDRRTRSRGSSIGAPRPSSTSAIINVSIVDAVSFLAWCGLSKFAIWLGRKFPQSAASLGLNVYGPFMALWASTQVLWAASSFRGRQLKPQSSEITVCMVLLAGLAASAASDVFMLLFIF